MFCDSQSPLEVKVLALYKYYVLSFIYFYLPIASFPKRNLRQFTTKDWMIQITYRYRYSKLTKARIYLCNRIKNYVNSSVYSNHCD